MSRQTVAVFPGCTEVGLEIWRSLKDCRDVALCSFASVDHHAPYIFGSHTRIPDVQDVQNGEWIEPLNTAIRRSGVDFLFPAHDDVVMALAQHSQEIDAQVITSPLETCILTRSKTRTYKQFGGKLPVPRLHADFPGASDFPVFVKPDCGQGSQRAARVSDPETLRALLASQPDLIVMENLGGKEFTVDCLTDRRRGLLFCGGRERIRTRSGISMNSAPVSDTMAEMLREWAEIISRELALHGAWFFQVKENAKGEAVLLEIAPRVGGTMAVHRVLGVNFPLLSLLESQGIEFEVMLNTCSVEIDRALTNRYRSDIEYDHVYVDLDDTLIVNGSVNTQVIALLFQALNRGCRITLLTRTQSDIDEVLRRRRLAGLFDDVIWVDGTSSKADHIDPRGAIFIDDSFSERRDVAVRHGIPTFDCSMLEMLLDDRTPDLSA